MTAEEKRERAKLTYDILRRRKRIKKKMAAREEYMVKDNFYKSKERMCTTRKSGARI